MQEDVGKERTDPRPLRCAPVGRVNLTALQDPRLQPHANKPHDAWIGDRCASIRSSHWWSTESKKLRISASSTQVTRWLIKAVCKAVNA